MGVFDGTPESALQLAHLNDAFAALRNDGGGPRQAPAAMQALQQHQARQKAAAALQKVQQGGGVPLGFNSPAFRAFATDNPEQAVRLMAERAITPEAQPKLPASAQEYNFARKQGFQGSFQDWLTAKAQAGATRINNNVNTGDNSPFKYGPIDKGYRVNTVTGVAEPTPGSAAAREIEQQQAKEGAQKQTKNRTADLMIEDIGRARDLGKGWSTTGLIGAVSSAAPGTPAHDLSEILVGIEANIGFDRLQRMRDESPTGGALGQVSDSERKALNSVLGSLRQSQSKEQFQFNLNRLQRLYGETIHGPQYREILFGDLARKNGEEQAYKMLIEMGY